MFIYSTYLNIKLQNARQTENKCIVCRKYTVCIIFNANRNPYAGRFVGRKSAHSESESIRSERLAKAFIDAGRTHPFELSSGDRTTTSMLIMAALGTFLWSACTPRRLEIAHRQFAKPDLSTQHAVLNDSNSRCFLATTPTLMS